MQHLIKWGLEEYQKLVSEVHITHTYKAIFDPNKGPISNSRMPSRLGSQIFKI